jgi:hypothetical protein
MTTVDLTDMELTTPTQAPVIEIEDTVVYPLAIDEQQMLERCELIIGQGLQTYIEVGRALTTIREGKLYRQHYSTWEEYCVDRWGMSRARAYQLIDASKVAADLSTIVDTSTIPESHMREIAKAAPADRPRVIERATELAGDGPRTAKHVQQAAAEIATPDLPPEFAIIQRRFATHGYKLTRHGAWFKLSGPDGQLVGTHATLEEHYSTLDRLEQIRPPEPPALADVLKRLGAHGYDQTGAARQKGMTTFYTFRDRASDLDEDSVGVIEMAEGQLPFWLAELDDNARRAEERNAKYLDARERYAALGWRLERASNAQFGLYKPTGEHYATAPVDAQLKTLATFEAAAAKKQSTAVPEPAESVSDRQAHMIKESRDAARIERARTLIERGDYETARTELAAVEVSTYRRDRLLAHIDAPAMPPDQVRVTLGFEKADCAALMKEAKLFERIDGLTKRMPTISQALLLLIAGIKAAEQQ